MRLVPIEHRFVLAISALLCLAVPARAAETVVDQHDLMFVPNAITIAVGDTVRFTDTDRITHNITITYPDGSVVDKGMDRYGEDIIVHFTKAGVYHVHCLIHPMMHMTVTAK